MSPSEVERAIIEGLGFRASDLPARAKEQLRKVALELAALETPELAALQRARELWSRLGEDRPLRVTLLPYVYPALVAEWRRVDARERRQAQEEAELWASLRSPDGYGEGVRPPLPNLPSP